ncbi:hypothetical protein L345_12810, partial [Ophiophagus hannah]
MFHTVSANLEGEAAEWMTAQRRRGTRAGKYQYLSAGAKDQTLEAEAEIKEIKQKGRPAKEYVKRIQKNCRKTVELENVDRLNRSQEANSRDAHLGDSPAPDKLKKSQRGPLRKPSSISTAANKATEWPNTWHQPLSQKPRPQSNLHQRNHCTEVIGADRSPEGTAEASRERHLLMKEKVIPRLLESYRR